MSNELSSARIWQHKLCVTLSTNVNINYCLPIIIYYRICTVRHIGIEIIHGSQNVLKGLTWVGRILVNFICQPMLKLKTHSGFHDLFLKFCTCKVSCQIISISLISSVTDCNLSLPQCSVIKKTNYMSIK
jgi:hypothetical protein